MKHKRLQAVGIVKSRNNKKVDNGVLWDTASKTRCFDVGLIVF